MELLNTLGIGRRMDVGGQKYGGGRVCVSGTEWLFNGMRGGRTCLCQRNEVAVQRYVGRPDVSVSAERDGSLAA